MAHPLSGADLATLVHAFGQGGRPDRWGRALAIGGACLGRAPLSLLESALTRHRLPRIEQMPPPVFILGHWRSGTTHLYNALAQAGWGYVPPVAVGLPWDMLGLGRVAAPLLERALPEHRWIDRIPVTPTSPQEDEIAIASMSPLSFYHGIYFPRAFDRLIDRGVFFDGCTGAEIDTWTARFTLFMRKLAHAQGKRLLIKNPVYTARVGRLRRIFPGAKFIHIHRNPHDVFLSMRNFYARLLEVMALQDIPGNLDVDATILRVYDRMMGLFEAETAGLGAPDFVELPYAWLDRDPLAALAHIYDQLDLDGFETARPALAGYLDSVSGFRKNAFRRDQIAIDKVTTAWGRWIDKWGYGAPTAEAAS